MEFRKMVTTTLYARQQGKGGMTWEHSIATVILYEIDDQSKFSAWNRALKVGALVQPRGME